MYSGPATVLVQMEFSIGRFSIRLEFLSAGIFSIEIGSVLTNSIVVLGKLGSGKQTTDVLGACITLYKII